MSEHRKPSFVLPAAVTLAVLLALYVGAYYAMVTPNPVTHGAYLNKELVTWVTFLPEYSRRDYRRDEWCFSPFFTPIHRLDRRIRPHVWDPK